LLCRYTQIGDDGLYLKPWSNGNLNYKGCRTVDFVTFINTDM